VIAKHGRRGATSGPAPARATRLLIGLFVLLAACDTGAATPTPPPPSPTLTAVLLATPTPPPPTTEPTLAPTPTLGPGMFVNPVLDQDFPDPDSLKVGDTYYAYATNTTNINIQAAKSTDLVHWQLLRDALPVLPAWAQPNNTWAPEVTTTADGKSYVMYFAAQMSGGKYECIGVATSAAPDGRFRSPATTPLICPQADGGAIDPASFTDSDGTRYLLWKNDGNCCGAHTWLWIQKIAADGLTLLDQPHQIIKEDLLWEGNVIEAPTLWKQGSKYYLFYSANAYNSINYAVGYAVADSILGPYTKAPEPLLKSRMDQRPIVVGPGGQDITVDKQGRTWMLYHTWDPTVTYRNLNIDRLDWQGDTPVLAGPHKEPEPAP
jgi:beta-xylosidase